MATVIKPEISPKKKYWIERHRYYELKHFCLQYKTWNNKYKALDSYAKRLVSEDVVINSDVSDPTERCVEERDFYMSKIEMLNRIALETDPVLGNYVLIGVTEGIPYESLKLKHDIPCCRDTYYNLYRRFFWLLSKERK